MSIYRDFKKDPKAVSAKLIFVISIITCGNLTIKRLESLTSTVSDKKGSDDVHNIDVNEEEDSTKSSVLDNSNSNPDQRHRLLDENS